ncbi:hypothetical protein [Actinotignum sanguinis]|uniref:hypothetical protein n=1 Tax=Actinotignum sanguinis TaxID=1445614 RepID=UPI00237E66B2|nr:hypothetical protein [Actinotignum sanguinis]MDE1552992.1 hypothetical protein [Actinotignum sanguinis]MDE1565965.1 hypothetical protein [Actinotignum sanguinis]MDE1577480.1 hypothetical protein [Actinotignum sanguinis]MDE1641645.1 hypothetical protein [Actinotignum sanguinis]MDK8656274.1 hypothetical protein [Actinotignum sanguinis]
MGQILITVGIVIYLGVAVLWAVNLIRGLHRAAQDSHSRLDRSARRTTYLALATCWAWPVWIFISLAIAARRIRRAGRGR